MAMLKCGGVVAFDPRVQARCAHGRLVFAEGPKLILVVILSSSRPG
jgi:hypothetical protein